MSYFSISNLASQLGSKKLIVSNLKKSHPHWNVKEVLRKTGINSQEALEFANNKFTKRYNYSEKLAQKENKNFAKVSLEKKHKYWLKSKKINL